MKIAKILKESIEKWASDAILTAWTFPILKINWDIHYLQDYGKYTDEELREEVFSTMTERQKKEFLEKMELDYSIDLKSCNIWNTEKTTTIDNIDYTISANSVKLNWKIVFWKIKVDSSVTWPGEEKTFKQ